MSRETLKLLLIKLQPYRDMAEDFLIILEECKDEDQEFVDRLSSEIVQGIKRIESKEQIEKITKEISNIKKQEEAEIWRNKKDLEELENLINNIG